MKTSKSLEQAPEKNQTIPSGKLDLYALLRHIDEQFGEMAETKHLFFALSYARQQAAGGIPKVIDTDPKLVHEVLDTLVDYAIEHTNRGRLGLHASSRRVSDNDSRISFELAYTGDQKKDVNLDIIFGNEGISENNTKSKIDPALSICRQQACELGGNIGLNYRAGGITSLTFELPCKLWVQQTSSLYKDP